MSTAQAPAPVDEAVSGQSDAAAVTPRHFRRLWPWLAVLLTASLLAAGAFWWTQRESVIFPAGKAFSVPIVEGPRLDPESEAMAALLHDPTRLPSMNLNRYGNPVYVADASTPRYDLVITRQGTEEGKWGNNVLADQPVPIPEEIAPSSGSDAKIAVIDPITNQVFDLWRVERVNGQWQAEWGGIYPLDGDGSSHRAAYGDGPDNVPWPDPVSRSTGAGVSSLAGLIRSSELAEGVIPHALVFSTDKPCGPANSGPFRFPATTTDGFIVDEPCLPQGARIQLDPSIDLSSLPELTPVEKIIGKALQDYGAYVVDGGGARLAFATEAARTPEDEAVYRRLDLAADYHALPNLPQKYRVLAMWDGS